MTIEQKRNEIVRASLAITSKAVVTEADLAEMRKLSARFEQLDIEERASRFDMIPRSQPGSGSGETRSSDSPERRAFSEYVRYGHSPNGELRDLTTGATSGGYFVPQEFYPVLTEAAKAWGEIIPELNNKKTDNGAPMKVAFSNDVTNMLNLDTEPSSMQEVEPSLSSLLLSTDALKTDMIKVTVAELQDSGFDLDAFVRDQFGKRYYRGLTNAVTNGTFAGSPAVAQNIESLLTAAYGAVTSAASGAIAWGDVVNTWAALDPAYLPNAIWVMSQSVRGILLGVTDSLGRPLYVPAPTAGAFDTLLGKRVILNQFMPTFAPGAVSLLFGDFKQGYLLREVKPGLAIVRLNERFMDTLEVGFLGYCRVGGVSTDAGTHPIIKLTQKSA
jgi:HK97 family phage major capsid protein